MNTPLMTLRGGKLLACLLAVLVLRPCPVRAQFPAPTDPRLNVPDNGNNAVMVDPSEVFLKAFTSVQQGEKLEGDGKLRPALAKYRFAASLLDQLTQTNPNWQPIIVKYRVRKTSENIQKLEDKLALQPQSDSGGSDGTDTGASAPVRNQRDPNAFPGPANGMAPGPAAPPYYPPSGPVNNGSNGGDDLPVPDDALPGSNNGGGNNPYPNNGNAYPPNGNPYANANAYPYAQQPPAPADYPPDRATVALSKKLDRAQKELKAAIDARDAAIKDKQAALKQKEDIEFQLHSATSGSKAAQARFDHIKSDRDDLQSQVDKLSAKYKEAVAKNPGAAETRKEMQAQIAEMKKTLAKSEADLAAAAKARDDLAAKAKDSEARNGQLTKERDAAVAKADSTKDAAQKIESLQTENTALTQKLTTAEASIAQLTAESVKRKEELAGMQGELTSLKTQLVTSRDQNDKSATTITELRKQLDDSARHLEELKTNGKTSEEVANMTHENDVLRGIVMRQLKDQARRMQARDLLNDELKRLDVQSDQLNKQVAELGRPTMQLTDEERTLFKDPQVTISDSKDNPASVAAVISAVKPKGPNDAKAPNNPAAGGGALAPGTTAQNNNGAAGTGASGGASSPKVETDSQPKVGDDLIPMARQAREEYARGKFGDAERTYEKLLAREPKNPYLLYNQGAVMFREDKLKSAEVSFKKAVAAAPKDATTMSMLGIVYYRMHRYDDAITYLTQAIQNDPKNATAHNYLGITASQKGWPEEAIEEIGKAIALNPNYADAHFNLAVVYATYSPPNRERAEEHYKIAISLGAAPDPTLEKLIKNVTATANGLFPGQAIADH